MFIHAFLDKLSYGNDIVNLNGRLVLLLLSFLLTCLIFCDKHSSISQLGVFHEYFLDILYILELGNRTETVHDSINRVLINGDFAEL